MSVVFDVRVRMIKSQPKATGRNKNRSEYRNPNTTKRVKESPNKRQKMAND